MKRRLITLLVTVLAATAAFCQKTRYEVLYTFVYDQQNYDYVQKLDFASGAILRDGERSIALNGQEYTVVRKDHETDTPELKSRQFTVKDAQGREYVMCFQDDSRRAATPPHRIRHQQPLYMDLLCDRRRQDSPLTGSRHKNTTQKNGF